MGNLIRKRTLVLSEVVLNYLEKVEIKDLLSFLRSEFSELAVLDFEMFSAGDQFGMKMIENFKERGIPLKGIEFFSGLDKVSQEYEGMGFQTVEIETMRSIEDKFLPEEEIKLVNQVEWLDEFEELWLFQNHYFMSLAISDKTLSNQISEFSLSVLRSKN